MTNLPKYLMGALLALAGICVQSCTQVRQPCLSPRDATLVAESVHYATDTSKLAVDTSLPNAVFVALAVNRPPSGTIYSKSAFFKLTLSPDSTICQWAFTTDSLKYPFDTLTFYYQRSLHFLSNACGYTYFYTLDSVRSTNSILDSLQIINSSVTNNAKSTHLKMFIHPGF